jgi:uncharacterized protein DUF5684
MLAQYSNNGGGGGGGTAILLVIYFAVIILEIAGIWKVFTKAGEPGWAAIIPIYNIYVMLKIGGHPGWWLLLFLIPFVNIVIFFIMGIDVAKSFGKSTAFGVGLVLLGFIFWPILGFGDARYVGPAAGMRTMTPPPPPMPAS